MEATTATQQTRRSRGRPRNFDPEKALDAAMRVFWRKGYEGTSLTDLTSATGMSRPSLYLAFGDKEALYLTILDRYAKGPSSYMRDAMGAPTGLDAVKEILYGAINLLTATGNPSICMIAQGTLVCGDDALAVRTEMIARRRLGLALLTNRLQRAVAEGELPPDVDTKALALYFATVLRGIGISALGGATREELDVVAEMALSVWPGTRVSAVANARENPAEACG